MPTDSTENDIATSSRQITKQHENRYGAADGKHKTKRTFSYPLDLGLPSIEGDFTAHSNYLILRSMNLHNSNRDTFINTRNDLATNSGNAAYEFLSTIQLYMPALVENIQQEYDNSQQSLIGQFGVEMAENGVTSLKDAGNATKKAAGAVVGTAIRGFLGHFNDAFQQQTGKIASAGIVGSYKGPTRRSQNLNFSFSPKSLPELKEVASIIKLLHLGALPSKQGLFDPSGKNEAQQNIEQGLITYGMPPLWYLEEVSPLKNVERYTPRFVFGPAGISSIRMNKTPDQYWKTFQGTAGDSATIELELTFTEMFALDQETYANDLDSLDTFIGE